MPNIFDDINTGAIQVGNTIKSAVNDGLDSLDNLIDNTMGMFNKDKPNKIKVRNSLGLNPEAVSDIGSNIASAIVLEKLAEQNIKNVKFYVNVFTLFRNFVNCLDGNNADKTKNFKSAMGINKVISNFIEDTKIFSEAALSLNLDIVLYVPDYTKVYKTLKYVRELEDFNGIKYYINLHQVDAGKQVLKSFKGIAIKTTHKIPYSKNMLILTHIGLDLLNYVKYKDVRLIESHTGEIKLKDKWYTKYFKIGNKNMSIMPFNSIMYYILGDSDIVKPQNIKLRKHLYKIALEKKWYSDMSKNETLHSLRQRDSILANDIKTLDNNLYD